MGRASMVGIVLALGMACSTPKSEDHAVRASDYDRTCSVASDCVAVTEGTIGCCGLLICPNAAIAVSSSNAYQHDLDARHPECIPPPPCVALTPNECQTPSPQCIGGVCTLVTDGGQM